MNRTIFISSTFTDLQFHRKAVWSLLEKFDVVVRGMERFGARQETPLATCMAELEQSDIYVGIVALKLGSIEPNSGKSYTQLEYERACELKKEILIYLVDEKNAKVSVENIDFGERREKLLAFKSILKERHTVDWFTTEADLASKLGHRLRELLASKSAEPAPTDEFVRAEGVLSNFLLLPRVHSGTEVRVRVKLPKQFSPASRGVCNAFNLQFGATIVGEIQVLAPSGVSALDTLLVPSEYAPVMLAHAGKELDIYATPAFSPDNIKSFRGKLGSYSTTFWTAESNIYDGPPSGLETSYREVEGAITLVLTKVAS
jgi:hypothetical protein